MTLGERIKEERERLGFNQSQFAEIAGALKQTQIRWEKDGTTPTIDVLNAWSVVGADQVYILTGVRLDVANTPKDDLAYIDEWDLSFSAGAGVYPPEHPLAVARRPFDKKWLAKKGLNAKNLILARVHGDSMEPVLHDKDLIMLDKSRTSAVSTLPLAVLLDDVLYVKMCQATGDGRIALISRNSAYETIYINKSQPPEGFEVVGAVVWSARSWV